MKVTWRSPDLFGLPFLEEVVDHAKACARIEYLQAVLPSLHALYTGAHMLPQSLKSSDTAPSSVFTRARIQVIEMHQHQLAWMMFQSDWPAHR
eukprot:1035418-Rhodomonas_salina.1